MKTAENIHQLIGNTPMVKINQLNPNKDVEIWAKLEGFNPAGSVKDRIAKYMIQEAEKEGLLGGDKIILEPTSGNTGIGLSMIAAAKGYKIILVMPKSVSVERRKILRAFGAQLVLTDADKGIDGSINKAKELAKSDKYVILDQFRNPANVKAHYETTGPEIWKQTGGRITHFVAGLGTSGTMMGVGGKLKQLNKNIKLVGIEPKRGQTIQGLKNMKDCEKPQIFDENILDDKINIDFEKTLEMARRLTLEEGIFAGMSSGAVMKASYDLAKKLDKGFIVTVFPDMGFKYLSTKLYSCRELFKCFKKCGEKKCR